MSKTDGLAPTLWRSKQIRSDQIRSGRLAAASRIPLGGEIQSINATSIFQVERPWNVSLQCHRWGSVVGVASSHIENREKIVNRSDSVN
jgi:hypothetical protein